MFDDPRHEQETQTGSSRQQWNTSVKPERGGCLTIWLIVSTIALLLGVVMLFPLLGGITRRPDLTGFVIVYAGILIVGSVGIYGIWNWKQWGVYTAAAMSIASPFLEALMGTVQFIDWVQTFVQLGVLYYLVKDKWDYFD